MAEASPVVVLMKLKSNKLLYIQCLKPMQKNIVLVLFLQSEFLKVTSQLLNLACPIDRTGQESLLNFPKIRTDYSGFLFNNFPQDNSNCRFNFRFSKKSIRNAQTNRFWFASIAELAHKSWSFIGQSTVSEIYFLRNWSCLTI